MRKERNLVGRKFRKLKVIEKLKYLGKNGQDMWLCKCDCGNTKEVATGCLVHNNVKSCGCSKNRVRQDHPSWTGYEEISGRFWNVINASAKIRNLKITITLKYLWNLFLKQNRRCALSGVELEFSDIESNRSKLTASLDRIDNSKGYVKGNVRWVHKDVNFLRHRMKTDFTDKELFILCKDIYLNLKGKYEK